VTMTLLGPVSLLQIAPMQTVIPFPHSRGFVSRPVERRDAGGLEYRLLVLGQESVPVVTGAAETRPLPNFA